jgi:hypothetical protein
LELGIQLRNGNVEGDVFFIEVAMGEIKQIIFSFGFELVSDAVEFTNNHVHLFKIELCQSIKLLDVREDFNQFLESLHELIKLIEDLSFREIKGFTLWHICYFFLGGFVGFFVLSVQFDAATQYLNDFRGISFPNIFDLGSWRNDLLSAVLDHLVGNLNEESCHFVGGVIEPCNGMDHFDGIHE